MLRPRQSRQEVLLRQVWSWLGISRSRQNFPCHDRESSRLKVSKSRYTFFMPRQGFCLGQGSLCRNSEKMMSRHSSLPLEGFIVATEISMSQ